MTTGKYKTQQLFQYRIKSFLANSTGEIEQRARSSITHIFSSCGQLLIFLKCSHQTDFLRRSFEIKLFQRGVGVYSVFEEFLKGWEG